MLIIGLKKPLTHLCFFGTLGLRLCLYRSPPKDYPTIFRLLRLEDLHIVDQVRQVSEGKPAPNCVLHKLDLPNALSTATATNKGIHHTRHTRDTHGTHTGHTQDTHETHTRHTRDTHETHTVKTTFDLSKTCTPSPWPREGLDSVISWTSAWTILLTT